MHHRVGGVAGKGEDVAILRPVATKAVDAAVVIARALTPLPMQPGWHASLAFSRSVLPQGKDFRYFVSAGGEGCVAAAHRGWIATEA